MVCVTWSVASEPPGNGAAAPAGEGGKGATDASGGVHRAQLTELSSKQRAV